MRTSPTSDEAWRKGRHAFMTAANGSLSVVAMHPIRRQNETFDGLAGRWSRLENSNGPCVTATLDDDIKVDGRLVAGTVTLDPSSMITFSSTQTGRVGQEVDSTWYLQVWDTNAKNLRDFNRIETYPYDPAWAVDAEFRLNPDVNRSFAVGRANDATPNTRRAPVDMHFTWQGVHYSLAAYATFVKDIFSVTFTDETTGNETPPSGRFVMIPRMPEGAFVFDFNRTMLLPSEFSSAYPCALAPPSNRLPFAVEAGEKEVLFTR